MRMQMRQGRVMPSRLGEIFLPDAVFYSYVARAPARAGAPFIGDNLACRRRRHTRA